MFCNNDRNFSLPENRWEPEMPFCFYKHHGVCVAYRNLVAVQWFSWLKLFRCLIRKPPPYRLHFHLQILSVCFSVTDGASPGMTFRTDQASGNLKHYFCQIHYRKYFVTIDIAVPKVNGLESSILCSVSLQLFLYIPLYIHTYSFIYIYSSLSGPLKRLFYCIPISI